MPKSFLCELITSACGNIVRYIWNLSATKERKLNRRDINCVRLMEEDEVDQSEKVR